MTLEKETKYFTINRPIMSAYNNIHKSTRNVKESMYLNYKQKEDMISQKLGVCLLKISVIENYDIIGIEECIENKGRYTTIKVISQEAVLYKITFEDFMIILNQKDTPVLQISLLVKERKDNILNIINKSLASKNDTINRRIVTELFMYVNKSNEMKVSTQSRLFSPTFNFKTFDNSNMITNSFDISKNKVISKQNTIRIKKNQDSTKSKNIPTNKNDTSLIESSFRISENVNNNNNVRYRNHAVLTENLDTKKTWKNIGFYHVMKKDLRDEIGFINLNHFVNNNEEVHKSRYPKRPFSSGIKKMKNFFHNKKKYSLRESTKNYVILENLFLSENNKNNNFRRGYLVSKQQSKFFKNNKK